MERKVELLAPCGDFECFKAAISAGADAVYLGGNKFGARAYANNFTNEEIIEAIRIAHIFSRKVYLTVNTLVKECEIDELVPFMEPLVEAGLDGVIIQDIGVFFTLRENFPTLELHASTQMTVTGVYGAKFLKEIGATRIVPARELSLEEIKDIKEATGLEIETFIHGAMCYAYSGQCLFSSILGGRSGNRGRCAGPCRLPYEVNGSQSYPLSLKDMYTLNMIPELIEAGIDSFKIEGRMKSPEYVAGVTSVYRKYIDQYLTHPELPYKVSKEDENLIRNLYIRSDICEGYYKRHNDKSMVTIHEPGYKGCSDDVLNKIRAEYIDKMPTISISGKAVIRAGEESRLKLFYKNIEVEATGNEVSTAMNRPLSKDDIFDKLTKTGNTCFSFSDFEIDTDNNSFMPVKALNELRREAVFKLEEEILNSDKKIIDYKPVTANKVFNNAKNEFYVSVLTFEQLEAVITSEFVNGLYIYFDLFLNDALFDKIISLLNDNQDKKFFISLPAILRKRSYIYLNKLEKLCNLNIFSGMLCKNMEEYIWLKEKDYQGEIIADYSIYTWNKKAIEIYGKLFTRTTLPIELNKKEINDIKDKDREIVLYTRLPLMYSANCIQKTFGNCLNNKGISPNITFVKDRHKNSIPIMQNCYHCYNILYNPVVLSLHNYYDSLSKNNFDVYRIEFTLESKEDAWNILLFYKNLLKNSVKDNFPVKDFTAGHYKRGAE